MASTREPPKDALPSQLPSTRPPSRPVSPSAPSKGPRPLLFTQPSSVHFGGFTLDEQRYSQRVFVHNNGSKPVRLQYTLPSKGSFRVSFPNERKPFISPGLSEELLVSFHPSAFQYYYDCVQVKCEEVAYASNADTATLCKILLPLHAYPVVNQVDFPTRMDFGAVPIGVTSRKHFDLTCSVPIEFEYELTVTKPHAAITIFPVRGVIPANGSARIEFEFKPLAYVTASAEAELQVSQLGFKPLHCVITGSSASDVVAETDVAQVGKDSVSKQDQRPRTASSDSPPSPLSQAKTLQSPSHKASPKGPKRSRQATESKKSEVIGGVEIPADLSSMTSVNFVLTQQPGKLKPKDLKKAIEANRAMRQQQKEEQAKLALSNDENDPTKRNNEVVSPADLSFQVLLREEATAIERAGVSRQIREMFFLQELSEIDTIEKELEFQSHKIRLGQELLTPEQIEILKQMREMNELELARREREKLRNDVETKAFHMFTQPTPELPYPPRGSLPAHFEPSVEPDFKTYKNDLWDRRKRVVQRFVRAISTVIYRNRAQKRLEKIRAWLGTAKTRAQVREKVALEWLQNARGVGANSVTANTAVGARTPKGTEDGVQLYFKSFPIVKEEEHRPRTKIALADDDWDLTSDPFDFLPLRERDEALLAGHEPLELPPLPTYVPLENTRELRTGALDECSFADLSSIEEQNPPDIPPKLGVRPPCMLELLPRDVFLTPSAAVRPFVQINPTRETLTTFSLRPQRVFRTTPRNWGLALETGIGTRSLFTLKKGFLQTHERYQPCTQRTRGVPAWMRLQREDQVAPTDIEKDVYRSVWDTSDGFIPPMCQGPDDVPYLSDSESDDEDEEKTPRGSARALPTWQDAVKLWEEEAENDDDDDGVEYEKGELYGKAQGIWCFERYRHLIQSEREYNAYRDEKLQQLPTLLREVASKIDHPDYQLVVEGHGPSRPLHEPFSVVFKRMQEQQSQQVKQESTHEI